jgi:hypothetical protein
VATSWPQRLRSSRSGATELVFALFDLLGLWFIPRLRDAGELRLHRIGAPTGLPVDELLSSKIRPGRIADRYDDLLRVAGSLKRGCVPASLLISRMRAASPKPPLAAALAEYGRLVRLPDRGPRRRPEPPAPAHPATTPSRNSAPSGTRTSTPTGATASM